MFNNKNTEKNILVLSFIPDDQHVTFFTPVLDYLGLQYDDKLLKLKDLASRNHFYGLFVQAYQGIISITGENSFIQMAAQNIDHARVVGDPLVIIDYHPDDGAFCIVTVFMPKGMGYVNDSIVVPAKRLAGHAPYEIAKAAIQEMVRVKDDCHKWTKELDAPVIYYLKSRSDNLNFGYSRGFRKPEFATIYGNLYAAELSGILSEIKDIQAIYYDPVPRGSIGNEYFQEGLFNFINEVALDKSPLTIIVETTKEDSSIDDLGLLDIYLISSDQVSNAKFSVADLESMSPVSAASHVKTVLTNK